MYLIKALAIGIQNLHYENLLHLDIKPSNFGLRNLGENNGDNISVSLFDINTIYSRSNPFARTAGTPHFRAPEMVDDVFNNYNNIHVGCLSDVYSLGATLYNSIIIGSGERGLYEVKKFSDIDMELSRSLLFEYSEYNSKAEIHDILANILKRSLARNAKDYLQGVENYISVGEFIADISKADEMVKLQLGIAHEEGTDKKATSHKIPNGVMIIGSYAFSGCENLTDVTMPETLIMIEEGAFWGCENLVSAKLPNSVTHIGDDAFATCDKLSSVIIPDSVTSIAPLAFIDCKNLKSITIPAGATIGEGAFDGCKNVVHAELSKEDTSDDSFIEQKTAEPSKQQTTSAHINKTELSEGFVIIDGVLKKYMGNAKKVVIPKTVKSICVGAFENCKNITSIKIPNSVKVIGDRSFFNCSDLIFVTIPDSVMHMGDKAFWGCDKLMFVSISNKQFERFKHAFPKEIQNCIVNEITGRAETAATFVADKISSTIGNIFK